jgi:hypothetical protein
MALGEESPIFTKTYDLLLWLSGRVTHFRKDQRFRLAQRIEDAAFGFHETDSGHQGQVAQEQAPLVV